MRVAVGRCTRPWRVGVKSYAGIVEGRVIEAQQGDLGGERVLVDGREVSASLWAGLMPKRHAFEVAGAD